jgi:hypothetical protein
MGPLVYYCRWQNARLRLRGRDDRLFGASCIFHEEDNELSQPFRFDHKTWELWITEDGETRHLQLMNWG